MNPTILLICLAACAPADPPAPEKGPPPEKPARPMSPAEGAAQLRQAIATTEKELARLQGQLDDPRSDYHQAQKKFKELDAEVMKKREQVRKLRDDGQKEQADKLEKEIAPLEKERKSAEERLVLEGKERALLQEKVDALKEKLQKDQKALAPLEGKPGAGGPKPPKGKPADKGAETPKDSEGPGGDKPKVPESKEVTEAKEQARQKDEQARRADVKARSLSERVQLLRKNIDLEQGLIRTAREKGEQVRKAREGLEKELRRLTEEGAAADKLRDVRQKIAEESRIEDETRQEAQTATQRLTQLRAELTTLQAEQILALAEADRKRREAEEAREKLVALQNPFTWQNLSRWFLTHGPKILLILLGLVLFQRLVVFSSRRIAGLVARTSMRQRPGQQDHRPETLAAVFRQVLTFLLICGATLMILDEVGLSITTLLGGVAVVGLAVSFAGQNLIKDYFYGFLVLFEDQYGVDDFIRVGDVSGTVERITLRVTILRDLEGIVHFVPHGSITTVSNLTHGWSRAMLEVQVAYKEDVDRAIGVLRDLAGDLRRDPYFGLAVVDEPRMLGVDALGDSGVTIKFFLETKPARQWEVKREMLRRVKKKFDELGIEIPFPHRTLYHRHEEAGHPGVEVNGLERGVGEKAFTPSS
jgi:small-conductance mechanosensitive channel